MSENKRVPVIALRDLVVFPRMVTHFDCGRQKSIAAVEAAEINNSYVFLVAQRDSSILEPQREDLFDYGTLAAIKQILKLPGGVVRVLVEGVKRAKIEDFSVGDSYFEAIAEEIDSEDFNEENQEVVAAMRLVEEDLENYTELDSRLIPGLLQSVVDSSSPESLVDTSAAYINLDLEKSQDLLETLDAFERLTKFHGILKREIELLSIERKIDKEVKSNMNKVQREYYLKEQLKVIHKELGDGAEEDTLLEYEEKIEEANLPDHVREKALKEVSRLSKLTSATPEYSVILTYLDWILDLPWNESSPDEVELSKARETLDAEHYGLKDVKERILEFMAVRNLTSSSKGPILCLVGPPGVGKTSIASSIANSLSKEFVRMSLGGITDEAEIRGHRRTYIGALPGRVISLMKKAEENNPVFLLDEIDKVGSDFKGDPASGLLEVLDPEQNNTFTDRYLELPFDLSKVFFIATANSTNTIPRPLLDRMEVIRLSGYTPQEKFQIAKRYLVPKQIKENGLKKSQLKFTDGAIQDIINYYTREAGVRGLEKEIAKCVRKAVLKIVEEHKKTLSVTENNLSTYLGEKKFLFDLVQEHDRVGVVNGLAWTEVGGETLEIESTVMEGSGKLMLTGKLGDVMKESANAAISYIASNAESLNIDPEFRKKSDIHIHVPEGAVPKDGPSAGVAMFSTVLSSLTGKKIKSDVAMTGEITLTGRVLPIGGLKEKLLAAERMGIKKVLIPKENERDLKEIDENIVNKLEIVTLNEANEAIEHIFGGNNED
ncbi:ATP-dependent Lon protease [Peptoniphilus asaccharolyticus DSM 20463]|uniref:Lon protease n=1 Tax=Peptoniphilus asaccharolyticus DSM 20463 TaxID=573058 RepID=A0A1W1VFR2_PEPAS|nr:endopeptidase La [Peptoniphilus asaccharolyticus]MBL7575931.1 endopeptidase La [Peptoniphilus asaccharolyticus]SMB91814.1 ATP-dependent Lon protease [Peptoniphilus asaccharolyticus DSM 20463]